MALSHALDCWVVVRPKNVRHTTDVYTECVQWRAHIAA